MIITKLNGGLGNQMFQYAAGRNLALTQHARLVLDIQSYSHQLTHETPRNYELDIFKLKAPFTTNDPLYIGLASKNNYLARCLRRIGLVPWVIGEPSLYAYVDFRNLPKRSYLLNGYWQSERYFEATEDIIRRDFTFPSLTSKADLRIAKLIQTSASISLHVRRGDMVSDKAAAKHHGAATLNYYTKAIKIIESKVKSPVFFVFSDDINWCKENINQKNTIYIDHNSGKSAYRDMQLMSLCRHNIIANSSFSWWGAWLNSNKDKIVIAPRKWLQDPSFDTSNVVPDKWMKL